MVALTQDRSTPERIDALYEYDMAADEVIFAGALVVIHSGLARPGSSGFTDWITVGRAEEHVDNRGGAHGAKQIRVKRGTFRFENSAGADEITDNDVGFDCYVVDDQTVAKTNGTNTRSVAGKVRDVDEIGVWIEI